MEIFDELLNLTVRLLLISTRNRSFSMQAPKGLVGVSRKKSYLDTVRQLNYWSGHFS